MNITIKQNAECDNIVFDDGDTRATFDRSRMSSIQKHELSIQTLRIPAIRKKYGWKG